MDRPTDDTGSHDNDMLDKQMWRRTARNMEGSVSAKGTPHLPPGFHRNCPLREPDFEQSILALGLPIPADYCLLMRHTNGGEGLVGDEFVRLYRVEQLTGLNKACGTDESAPGILVVGSNGGGEALAFDLKDASAPLIKIPFIPMAREYAVQCARTITDFLSELAQHRSSPCEQKPDPSLFGKEIHEITPIVFGGDPVDAKNKQFLSIEEYAPFVLFWNRKWRDVRKGRSRKGPCSGPPPPDQPKQS